MWQGCRCRRRAKSRRTLRDQHPGPGQSGSRRSRRIRRLVKINGFVASTPDFVEQHLVINGASNLLANALGEAGKHARAAVGMASLPFNAAVEIDAVIEIA